MNRGNSNRGARGVPTGVRGSSFRGRGRGAPRGGFSSKFASKNAVDQDSLSFAKVPGGRHQRTVKVDPPVEHLESRPSSPYTHLEGRKYSKTYADPTSDAPTANSFEAERNANAARREQRGQRGGSGIIRGAPDARGAFKNKTVRFSSPTAQQNAPVQKPFVIPKIPGAPPPKSKLPQAFTSPPSDPDGHTMKIKKALQHNRLANYPDWPTAQPGDPSQKAVIKSFWDETKEYRAKVRKVLMNNGLIDDPDKPKKLSEAIDFKGTCEEMCPRFEQITRIMEHDVKNAEKEMAFDGSMWPAPDKMIKAYGRSSAGQDAPLPSDIRTPGALRRTLDYLIKDVLGEEHSLPTVHNFLWDRTRSIRRDFTFQQASLTATDYLDEVYCLETIARFHVVALHQMSDPTNTSDDFSEHQEVEQLGRTLLSLIHTYEDCKAQGIQCENEAEFRAYFVVYHARNPAMMEAVQDWGREFWESDDIQTATSLVECLHTIWEINGPLKPHSASDIALNMYNRFFDIIQQPEISYTMACFAEIHFTSVRKTALMTILSAYRKQRDQTTDWTLAALNSYLRFDSPDDVEEFVEAHGLNIKDTSGDAYLDFDSGSSLMEPEVKIKQPHSTKLVERKRGQKSLPACIYSNAYATVDNAEDSLFVGESDVTHLFKPQQRTAQYGKPPIVGNVPKLPAATNTKFVGGSITNFGGFIDSDDELSTKPAFQPTTQPPSGSIFSSTANKPSIQASSFTFGTPLVPSTSFSSTNAAPSSVFAQSNGTQNASSIFANVSTPVAPSAFSFLSTAKDQQTATSTTTQSSIFPQSAAKAAGTSFFANMQNKAMDNTNTVLSTPSTAASTAATAPVPTSVLPTTTPSLGGFSFSTQGTASQTPSPFLSKPAPTESTSSNFTSKTSFFPTTTQTSKPASPFVPTTASQGTSIFPPIGISSTGTVPQSPFGVSTPVVTSTGAVTSTQASQPSSIFAANGVATAPVVDSSIFAPKPKEKPSDVPASETPSSIFSGTIANQSTAQAQIQQPAVVNFGALGNHAVSAPIAPNIPETPPTEQARYNWLAPPSSTKIKETSTLPEVQKKTEMRAKPPAPAKTPTVKAPAPSAPSGRTLISNLAPFLAEWVALGEGGIIDQFTVKEVEKACRDAYDDYYEQLDVEQAAAVKADKEALQEAKLFRQYSLGVKYFYRWRTNAQKLWQRKAGKRARELRKQMAEEQRALSKAAKENVVEDFTKSVTASKNKRKPEEDMLAATGVLHGVRDSGAKIRKIVHSDMAAPKISTTPAGSPVRDRFGRSISSLGHSTASLQSLLDGDHIRDSGTSKRRSHTSMHKRSRSESIRKDIPLNMSHGGSRIHLMPPTWNPKDDMGPKPNNVQTDYFRLKARGIYTLPNGAPLASSAAVHLRPSLIESAKHSLSRNTSATMSKVSTPDQSLKRSVSGLSYSAPAKRARAAPMPPPGPNHKQEMEEIKERARRIMNEDALKRRLEEQRTKSQERGETKDEEMEELFRRSRKLKEDMATGEEWFRKYNESWSRSVSRGSGSAQAAAPPSTSAPASAPTSAPRQAPRPAVPVKRTMEAEIIELD